MTIELRLTSGELEALICLCALIYDRDVSRMFDTETWSEAQDVYDRVISHVLELKPHLRLSSWLEGQELYRSGLPPPSHMRSVSDAKEAAKSLQAYSGYFHAMREERDQGRKQQPRVIGKFVGRYSFLSNFHLCPRGVIFDGREVTTTEAAYQASKTLDPQLRQEISSLAPGPSKRRGREVDLRPDWEEIKEGVMRDLLWSKFTRDGELRSLLLATGQAHLIEGNTWGDIYWGVCDGVGENRLGKLLMSVRDEIRAGQCGPA